MAISSAATLVRPESLTNVEEETKAAVGRPIQVLLVEDSAEAAQLVQIYLAEKDVNQFRVEWLPNLREAMSRLAQPGVDVVLLDLGLPELNGYRSYRAIEAVAGRQMPVVILTADERSISKDLTLGLGAADYLLKHQSSPAQLKQALRCAFLRIPPEHTEPS